ncbi:MAG: hypothetical protein QOF14_4031 [Hyphomicrobiales bacterium]|nr:hypothetical protein [Hyphomicrobiales bacterium]
MTKAILAAMAAIAMCAVALPARAQTDCPAPTVVVASASKVGIKKLSDTATEEQKRALTIVELGDTIEVTMTGLPELLADADCRKSKALPKRTPILFLASYPIKGVIGYLPGPPTEGKIRFDLMHSEVSKGAWALVLANPWIADRPLGVSVGFEDSYPFKSSAQIPFRKLAIMYAILGLIFMVLLVVAFVYLLWFTDMCREGKPAIPNDVISTAPGIQTAYGPFSLSKVQAGIWFLVILGSYIFIVSVTHDLSGTVNATALTLMGIGAATMVGSAAIQTNQDQVEDAAAQADAARELAQRIQELKVSLKGKQGTSEGETIRKSLKDMDIAFKRATRQSIGIWTDMISDANGVNFHRFQMAAWTVVLASIFAISVTRVLAMPDFDNTLLALQGLSAGTYLGLKITEPKVTSVPEKPKAAETPPKVT